MSDIEKEIQEVLEEESGEIVFEENANEESSPLNQAVTDKDNGGNQQGERAGYSSGPSPAESTGPHQEPLDAPEQNINENHNYQGNHSEASSDEKFEIPDDMAGYGADAILGSLNNFIGVGGGFFVRIKKHNEFYDFEEIVQLIETQNERNVRLIKLDDEDLALLRPCLILVLKKRTKQLTPEQQFLAAMLSIMVKKAQVVIQIRAENEILLERILNTIREERDTEAEVEEGPEKVYKMEEQEMEGQAYAPDYEEEVIPTSVLEVAVEDEIVETADA